MLENPKFKQNNYSRTAVSIYKIGHVSMKPKRWLLYYDRFYYDNLNYFDLVGSLCKYLRLNEIPGR